MNLEGLGGQVRDNPLYVIDIAISIFIKSSELHILTGMFVHLNLDLALLSDLEYFRYLYGDRHIDHRE